MKPFYLVCILFFFSCNEQNKSTQKLSYEDTIKNILIGKWGGSSDSLPVWEIRKDSIYYFEHSRAHPYKIVGHNMIISLPANQGKLGDIHVIKDTFFFTLHPGVEVQAIRFR